MKAQGIDEGAVDSFGFSIDCFSSTLMELPFSSLNPDFIKYNISSTLFMVYGTYPKKELGPLTTSIILSVFLDIGDFVKPTLTKSSCGAPPLRSFFESLFERLFEVFFEVFFIDFFILYIL